MSKMEITLSKKIMVGQEAAYEIYRQLDPDEFKEGDLIVTSEEAALMFTLIDREDEIDIPCLMENFIKKSRTVKIYEVISIGMESNLDLRYKTEEGHIKKGQSCFFRLATEEERVEYRIQNMFDKGK